MGENVIILFIFFILLIFAVVFYSRLQTTKARTVISEDIESRALEIAQRTAFLPELQCSRSNAEIFPGCYDEYSMKGIAMLSPENKDYYYDMFGYSKITVSKLFPGPQNYTVIYNRQKPNASNAIATFFPLTVCNFNESASRKGFCRYGVLKIEVYS